MNAAARVRVLAPDRRRKARVAAALEKDRTKLLLRFPFTGHVAMRLDLVPVEDDRLRTAATDGSRIFFDCRFHASLTPEQRLFVLAHEVWHVALAHHGRRGPRDPALFNVAADLEIHFALEAEGLDEPWTIPYKESWRPLPAERIYTRLLLPARDSATASGGPPMEKDLVDRGDGGPPPEGDGGAAPRAVRLDPDFAPLFDPAEAARTAAAVRAEVARKPFRPRRGQPGDPPGGLPGGLSWLVERVRRPSVDWRTALRRFVTPAYGGRRRWLPPNRRHIADGLFLPSRRDDRLHAVLAIDTSGSTLELMPAFFAELAGLLRSFGRYELAVVQCDRAVRRVDRWSDTEPPPPRPGWRAEGGGGTDFRPVFEWVAKKGERPDALVYLTDGYGPAPARKPPYPVLWALPFHSLYEDYGWPQPAAPAPWGTVVRVRLPAPAPSPDA